MEESWPLRSIYFGGAVVTGYSQFAEMMLKIWSFSTPTTPMIG
ncbi:hypothetical protein P3T40_008771 [Paraburkholderia sp. EB58]|jgi:hypothetical protein